MTLVTLDLPAPIQLRGGWAALAAVCASKGWETSAYATADQWLYHDGGGNWACLRFKEVGKAILIGHDHEYSDTYYGEAAQYFQEEETDLLAGAPDWWGFDLNPRPFGEWIGFVYGWEEQRWRRASYTKSDGFTSVGLLKACSVPNTGLLESFSTGAPGLNGQLPDAGALKSLVAADGEVTHALLESVVPGWDIDAGVAAAQRFLEVDL